MTRDKLGIVIATAVGVATESVLFGVLAGVAAGSILKDMGLPAELPEELTPGMADLATEFANWAKEKR